MTFSDADFPVPDSAMNAGNRFEIVPPGRPELAFGLHLPAAWANDPSAVDTSADGTNWTSLAAFAEKPSGESPLTRGWAVVSVLWRRLEFEVPLDEWAAVQLGGMQVDIAMMRSFNEANGLVIDAGGACQGVVNPLNPQEGPASIPIVLRAMVRADGQNVFAVWCMATPDAYPAARDHFATAGASFALLHPTGTSIEALARAEAVNPPFGLLYPSSWLHQPVDTPSTVAGKSALDLMLVEDQLLKGYIRVKAVDLRQVRPTSVEVLLQDAVEELAQAGVVAQGPWSQLPDPTILSIPDLRGAYTAPGQLQDTPYELHYGIALRPPTLFCVTALVLPLNADALMCLRGHRAYEIVLKSAAPLG
jgi:hypothetical protein